MENKLLFSIDIHVYIAMELDELRINITGGEHGHESTKPGCECEKSTTLALHLLPVSHQLHLLASFSPDVV